MYKIKILLVFLLASSALAIISCNCRDIPYIELGDINTTLYDSTEIVITSTVADSLVLAIGWEQEYVANNFQPLFINQAYGFTPCPKGELGLKVPISDYKIFSNYDYLDFPAGTEIILENHYGYSKEEQLEHFNGDMTDFVFLLNKKQTGVINFQISLLYESGIEEKYDLLNFVWE